MNSEIYNKICDKMHYILNLVFYLKLVFMLLIIKYLALG